VTNRTKQSTTEQHGEKREGERQPKKKWKGTVWMFFCVQITLPRHASRILEAIRRLFLSLVYVMYYHHGNPPTHTSPFPSLFFALPFSCSLLPCCLVRFLYSFVFIVGALKSSLPRMSMEGVMVHESLPWVIQWIQCSLSTLIAIVPNWSSRW
jgi:hypothetical protein